MKLLHIDSSVTGEASASRQLSAAIVKAAADAIPGLEIIRRDLDANPLPHLDSALLTTIRPSSPADATTPAAYKAAAVLDEFLDADIVVIGAPMYNFTIPSQLKAWFDRILIAGKTFSYTAEAGAKGLAGDKKVIVASSRGGLYAPGTPQEANDFQEPYLRAILGFIGVKDIEIVRAEGIAFGPEQREAAMRAALASVAPAVAGFIPAKAA
jgi:FMN-dependent NADH-azoreductase